jgi:hypothetical protein
VESNPTFRSLQGDTFKGTILILLHSVRDTSPETRQSLMHRGLHRKVGPPGKASVVVCLPAEKGSQELRDVKVTQVAGLQKAGQAEPGWNEI